MFGFNKKIRCFMSLVLSSVILISSFTGCASKSGKEAKTSQDPITENSALPALTSENDEKLFENPDRGYRTEMVFYVDRYKKDGVKYDARTVFVNETDEEIRDKIEYIFNIYVGKHKKEEQANLSLAYIYITPWREKELDEKILNFFKIFFTMCREQKLKNMLRICYCTSTQNLNEGADEVTIVRHIRQLQDIIGEYSDAIHTISCGFVGSYGEWAEAYQRPSVDYAKIIKAITEKLAVPNNLYFSIRLPKYKNLVGADYEHYWSISHNNDAMFGAQKKGWHSDGYELGSDDWEQVTREAAYTPQDGEMFVNSNLLETRRVPSGMEILLECYYHRHTSMSFWHGYLDNAKGDNVMKRWQEYETISSSQLDANKVIYDPNWFLNKNGEAVNRNPYEFIRDHLGYRLSANEVNISWSGKLTDRIKVEMKLKNYGFAAAFNMESGFALLDENYNLISEIKAGEPKTWYNRDPENSASTECLTHTVSAELEARNLTGQYYIAFYLKNTMNTYAALANNIPYENGYNILKSFEIK